MNKQSNDGSASLHSDLPLSNADEDIFGWRDPVKDLASILVDSSFNTKGSFVASIEGKWGSGKSSYLFLLKKAIKELDADDSVTILDYNPWLMPKQDHAVYFFDQMSRSTELKHRKLTKLLKQFGSLSTHTTPFIEDTKTLIRRVLGVLLLLGITAPWILESVPNWLSPLLLIPALAIIFLDWFSKLAWNAFNKHPKSVQTIKEDLVNILRKSSPKRRFVICIDDVDRLTGEQIFSILQLVKNNGDLPNTLYLICMDSEHVAKQLDNFKIADSQTYLEKFSQLRIHVPAPSSKKYEEYFDREIESSLPRRSENFDSLWSENLWESTLKDTFLYLLKNIRGIKRFVNSARANMRNSIIDNHLQINPLDFLCIELIRTIYPQLYLSIAYKSSLLLTTSGRYIAELEDEGQTQSKQEYKDLVSVIPTAEQAFVEKLLEFLFPKVELLIGEKTDWEIAAPLNEYEANLRLCHPKVFENYFSALVPKDRITENELSNYFDALKSNPPNRTTFVPISWNDTSQRLDQIVDRFRVGSVAVSSLEQFQRIITNLLHFSDDAPGNMDPHPLEYYAKFWIKNVEVESDRINTLHSSVQNSDALGGPAALLNLLYKDIQSVEETHILDSVALDYVGKIVKEAILEGSSSNRIRKSTRFRSILFYFKSHSSEEEYAGLLQHLFTTDKHLMLLVKHYFYKEFTYSGISTTEERKFDAGGLQFTISTPEIWKKVEFLPQTLFESNSDYKLFSDAIHSLKVEV